MSYQAQDSQILGEQLKVQELVLKHGNPLLVANAGDVVIDIKEEVAEIVLVLFKDDSAATIAPIAQAALTIETGTSTNSAIRIDSVVTAANDVIVVRYVVK